MGLNEMKITNYLDQTCSLVKNKKVHSKIKDELKLNIDNFTDKYEKLGNSKDKSIDLSLKDMGDSKKLGNELDKNYRLNLNPKILTIIGILIAIIFASSLIESLINTNGNGFFELYRCFIMLLLIIVPVVIFLIGSKIYFNHFKKVSLDINTENVSNYLNDICSQVKNKRVHSEIKNELKSHINKLTKHYKKLGHSDEESISLALIDMGSSSKLGSELNKTHKTAFDFKLLIVAAIIFLVGLVGTLAYSNYREGFSFGDLTYIPIVLIAFLVGSIINFRWFKKLSIPFYIVGIVLYILNRLDLGRNITGLIILNPYMYIPILILFGLSGIYLKFKFDNIKNISLTIILGIAPLLLFGLALLIPIQEINEGYNTYMVTGPSHTLVLPMILCYSIALLFIIYINSKSFKTTIITAILEIIIIVATTFKEFKVILSVNGWGMSSVHNILSSSKFIDTSLSPSMINNSYPLISLIGSFGFLAGIVVILALLYFIFRLYKVSFVINNTFGKSLALSISSIISVRIIIGILMNLGVIPYIQMPTPLLSYSGLSLITTIFLLGILTNIYKVRTLAKV